MCIHFINKKIFSLSVLVSFMLFIYEISGAQIVSSGTEWIRPVNEKSPAVWGIRNGIVFGLWPFAIESAREEKGGGPRGLIRVGYEFMGNINQFNFIAIEPVVNGKMEFSEISASQVDGKWGKLMWVSDSENPVSIILQP